MEKHFIIVLTLGLLHLQEISAGPTPIEFQIIGEETLYYGNLLPKSSQGERGPSTKLDDTNDTGTFEVNDPNDIHRLPVNTVVQYRYEGGDIALALAPFRIVKELNLALKHVVYDKLRVKVWRYETTNGDPIEASLYAKQGENWTLRKHYEDEPGLTNLKTTFAIGLTFKLKAENFDFGHEKEYCLTVDDIEDTEETKEKKVIIIKLVVSKPIVFMNITQGTKYEGFHIPIPNTESGKIVSNNRLPSECIEGKLIKYTSRKGPAGTPEPRKLENSPLRIIEKFVDSGFVFGKPRVIIVRNDQPNLFGTLHSTSEKESVIEIETELGRGDFAIKNSKTETELETALAQNTRYTLIAYTKEHQHFLTKHDKYIRCAGIEKNDYTRAKKGRWFTFTN